jgi:hypothetical protein
MGRSQMSWKFWKKKKSSELVTAALPISTLFHWYCYDLEIENPNALAEILGLSPMSTDVAEMELKASEQRLSNVAYILPFLKVMSDLNGLIASKQQLEVFKETLDLPEDKESTVEQGLAMTFSLLSLTTLISAFSAALELGLVSKGSSTPTGLMDRDSYE